MKSLIPILTGATGLVLIALNACGAPEPPGSSSSNDSTIDPSSGTGTGESGITSGGISPDELGSSSDEIEPTGATTEQDPIQEDCDSTLELVVRDFNSDHPDMEENNGGWGDIGCGMVMPDLFVGADGARTPLFQAGNGTGKRFIENNVIRCEPWGTTNPQPDFQEIVGEETFNQWFSNVDGVNITLTHTLPLGPLAGSDSVYYFDSKELEGGRFFPADGQGFDEDTNGHNFHFTTEAHVRFTYMAGDKFTFSGDDDMWIFVNQKLALDLGGLHGPLSATIDFDAQAADLGISPGKVYNMDIFHAERHTSDSNYRIETSIGCFEQVVVPETIIR